MRGSERVWSLTNKRIGMELYLHPTYFLFTKMAPKKQTRPTPSGQKIARQKKKERRNREQLESRKTVVCE